MIALVIGLIVALAGCAAPMVAHRVGPNEGLILQDKNAIYCAGIQCERILR